MNITKEFQTLHLSDDLYIWDHYNGYEAIDFDRLYWGHFTVYYKNNLYPVNTEFWYIPSSMSGGDYSGDTVTRANYEVMLPYVKRSKFVKEVYGGHGSYGIAFNVSRLKGKFALELVDIFKGLENYPLIDEDKHGELEIRLELENWDNNLRAEFARELKKRLEAVGIGCDDLIDNPDPHGYNLYDLYRDLMEKTNTYPIFETGCNVYTDLDRLFQDPQVVFNLILENALLEKILVINPDFDDLNMRLRRPTETYPITLEALINKWGDLKEIDTRLTLYDKIYTEWCQNLLSFNDREALAEMKDQKFYWLYSVLKEVEKGV